MPATLSKYLIEYNIDVILHTDIHGRVLNSRDGMMQDNSVIIELRKYPIGTRISNAGVAGNRVIAWPPHHNVLGRFAIFYSNPHTG